MCLGLTDELQTSVKHVHNEGEMSIFSTVTGAVLGPPQNPYLS